MKIYNVGIKGIGSYAPPNVLKNDDIDAYGIGTNANWTKNKLGIEERRIATEETSDLGYKAGLKAIEDSKLSVNDIDLIILATSSPDRISPSTACIMADRLGTLCPAFDINAVCGGFIYGLQLASNLIATDQYKNILLVASEKYSKITDWEDRSCVFFGDGAGAVVVGKTRGGWISTDIYSDPSGKENFTCPINDHFKMNGKAVYDFGTKRLPATIENSLKNNNLTVDNISWLIPHQPSIHILIKTAEIIGLPIDKVVLNMKEFANTAGASIPMALDTIYKNGDLKSDELLVMPAVGSGWVWGVSIIKYNRT